MGWAARKRRTAVLSPDERTLLVDLLAPPGGGYHLEWAVATTFTLDLTALLPVPLGFAGADLSRAADPLSLLQAARNYSDRIDVFCQAGHVAVPTKNNDLLAFLEPMVHQVRAPRPGHLFHPKLWALRYANRAGHERLRLVVGSRNLTHDRAWDVVVSLEGTRRSRRSAVNRPLADFLASLVARVPAGVSPARSAGVAALADAFRYAEWERPDSAIAGEDWLAFHVFGTGRATPPNLDGYRRLVISPFLNEGGLDRVWPDGSGECVMVSRAEELNAIGDRWHGALAQCDLQVFDETAAIPDTDSEETGLRWSLSGLHAKLYVTERNKQAHVFIGSANATDAAWGGNDEILIEIVARVAACGVQATLGTDKPRGAGLSALLLPHTLGAAIPASEDEELRWKLENALRDLASHTFTAVVEEGDEGGPRLLVTSDDVLHIGLGLPEETTLSVELMTLAGQAHRPSFGARLEHRWQLSRIEDITPFLILRLAAGSGAARVDVSSVVVARLIGDPVDRLDRVLARRIGTPEEFLRFLLLLLQLGAQESWLPEGSGLGIFSSFADAGGASGLLEAIVTALAVTPAAIDDIERLAARLSATEQGRLVLPDGWNEFWQPVVEARSLLEASR